MGVVGTLRSSAHTAFAHAPFTVAVLAALHRPDDRVAGAEAEIHDAQGSGADVVELVDLDLIHLPTTLTLLYLTMSFASLSS